VLKHVLYSRAVVSPALHERPTWQALSGPIGRSTPVKEVLSRNRLCISLCCVHRSILDDADDVRRSKVHRVLGEHLIILIIESRWTASKLHVEDFLPCLLVGKTNLVLLVKATSSHGGLVEEVGAVRRSNHEEIRILVVQVGEELVDDLGVFTMEVVVATGKQGVDFVDEDDTPIELLGLGEELVYLLGRFVDPAGLDIARRQLEIRMAEFTGDRSREQSLSTSQSNSRDITVV